MTDGKITRTQWKGLIAAWLGWAFDGLDGYLYVMVATPLVTRLLQNGLEAGQHPDQKDVATKAAIIQCFFLVGWAIGGAVFGRIGDRLGRAKTLTLTILTYALFTGLSAFATQWWHLLIFRFIAALGIGGEWAAGSALVCEMLHKKHRAWASATLQSGYMVGCILACFTVKGFAQVAEWTGISALAEPRWVFLVGVVPALLTVWIRRAVPEPEQWERAARQQTHPPISTLFSGSLLKTTLLTTALTSIALTTVWSFLYFGPQAIGKMPEVKDWTPKQVTDLKTNVTIFYLLVNIGANYFATYLARWIGHRKAFTILMVGSLASFLIGFGRPITPGNVYLIYGVVAFFGLGLFGLFPLYIPLLFPTLVRTLGAGFTYNVGRLVSAVGTIAMASGLIAVEAGSYAKAIWYTGFLYIAGIVVAMFVREVPREQAEAEGCEEAG